MVTSDLDVTRLSSALSERTIDLVVSGSIGAVESVRFIRALRRYGAKVQPWLTEGGAQFVTETALSWAAAGETRQGFSGERSHIAEGDGCVVAPATANMIYKIAHGITDTPESALVTSYLGQKKPVIIVPNMHESLFDAPAVQENLEKIKPWGVIVAARKEEGKKKFPEPDVLASHVAHHLNNNESKKVVVTMGPTKGYIDDVRYISNYSSGALGSQLSEELYRRGFNVTTITGDAKIKPTAVNNLVVAETNIEMQDALAQNISEQSHGAVFAASVLDFIPEKPVEGKIRSSVSELSIKLKAADKILASVPPLKRKVGFKLESTKDDRDPHGIAQEYLEKYGLTMLVVNYLEDVSASKHKAQVFTRGAKQATEIVGKRELVQVISDHVAGS